MRRGELREWTTPAATMDVFSLLGRRVWALNFVSALICEGGGGGEDTAGEEAAEARIALHLARICRHVSRATSLTRSSSAHNRMVRSTSGCSSADFRQTAVEELSNVHTQDTT